MDDVSPDDDELGSDFEPEPGSDFEPEPDPELEPEPESDVEASVFVVESSFFDDADRDAEERSFFAQPEPLKWKVGGVNAFVMVPSAPHSGQNLGPWSLIPWTTSVRWPQLLQT